MKYRVQLFHGEFHEFEQFLNDNHDGARLVSVIKNAGGTVRVVWEYEEKQSTTNKE
jgi:hypothetical protein